MLDTRVRAWSLSEGILFLAERLLPYQDLAYFSFNPNLDTPGFGVKFPMFNADFLQQVQTLAQEGGSRPSNVFQIFNQDLQAPYTMQFSLDVQRQLTSTMVLNTGFVGTRGVKLTLFRSANRVDRITGVRPNPGLSQPIYSDNSQTLSYYSWQSSLKKRFSNRFSFDVSYTWSKALG